MRMGGKEEEEEEGEGEEEEQEMLAEQGARSEELDIFV